MRSAHLYQGQRSSLSEAALISITGCSDLSKGALMCLSGNLLVNLGKICYTRRRVCLS